MAGAASNQEQLAGAAQQAVKTITRLADVVKFGASSLGADQPEAQVNIISFNDTFSLYVKFLHNITMSKENIYLESYSLLIQFHMLIYDSFVFGI